MTKQELIRSADTFRAEELSKHFGDRSSCNVIEADATWSRETPESADDDGNPIPATRTVEVEGSTRIDFGREYFIPWHIDPLVARNVLIAAHVESGAY